MPLPRLLVVGSGPAGIQIVRNLYKDFQVILVEPKDYYEFTPGILRGLCDAEHLETLQVKLEDALHGMGVTHIKGQVLQLEESSAWVQGNGSDGEKQFVDFDFAVLAMGSQYAGTELWKVVAGAETGEGFTLDGRQQQLQILRQELRERAASGGQVILLGAGLVGVELAAELIHFFPTLKIALADRCETVLPTLPKDAQDYAQKWLIDHGIDLRLGQELPREDVASALDLPKTSLVLPCAGLRFRGSSLVPRCCDEMGQICTNRAMQCMEQGEGTLSPIAKGRIFALGDCVKVLDAMRFTKDIYPAEAMVEVVVANLRALKRCKEAEKMDFQELPTQLQEMTLCSLGPNDCIYVMNGGVVTTGWLAAQLKHQVEVTKMGEIRQEMWGSFVWSLIPHW